MEKTVVPGAATWGEAATLGGRQMFGTQQRRRQRSPNCRVPAAQFTGRGQLRAGANQRDRCWEEQVQLLRFPDG